jgi:hypothetical protein
MKIDDAKSCEENKVDQTRIDIERIWQKLKLRRQQILEFLKRLDDETQALDPDSA